MLPWLLANPALLLQASLPLPALLPVVEAKDLPPAPRGPLVPLRRDLGTERGIFGKTRRAARAGPSLPALQIPAGSVRVKDRIPDAAGWRAYAVEVPAGGKVKVQVVEGRKAWFRVLAVNAWGQDEPGLRQNDIPTGESQASYENPSQETRTVYFIVDTLDVHMIGEAYAIDIIRR